VAECAGPHLPRRALLRALGIGAAVVLAGCSSPNRTAPEPRSPPPPAVTAGPPPASAAAATSPAAVDAPLPGGPAVITRGPAALPRLALTVDDGYCRDCVSGYTDFAVRTGIPLTLSPNGTYDAVWRPVSGRLAPLVERGQLQVINHTFTHRRVLGAGSAVLRDELERNEAWISTVFRTTARPWWRPPYGQFDETTAHDAATLGYDRLVMWNGSYGDAQLVTPEFLLHQADMAFRLGAIVLGHANHPTVLALFDQLESLLTQRGLQPVTVRTLLT